MTLVVSIVSVYFKTNAEVNQIKKDVSEHELTLKTYNLAVFQYQLDDIQGDIKEIKELIKEDKNELE